ncbi:hypothetical protein [Microbacterium hibisci]|uniref:hypothetical protein n=1 Tax=Microbacterium hibisci TaxID=2036000 RepID=UPI0027D9DD2F|nr:hypothetical protein [Microbacterium hibisci]
MRVELDAVGKGRREHALPLTSTAFESGRVTLAVAETAQRPTVLGLLASGRMRPDTGRVTLDGRRDSARLRRRVALVDAPDVSEPEPNVTLAGVAAEELMFAGRRSDPLAVRRWLSEHGLDGVAGLPVSNVDPADRVRALCELAVLRRGVEGLVLVSPDRHGGEPAAWWAVAEHLAARGLAVLVIAGQASAPVAVSAPLTPAVERAKRDETPQTVSHERRVSSRSFLARSTTGWGGRLRLRRLTAPTRGDRP